MLQPGPNTWPIVALSYIYVRKDLSHITNPVSQGLLQAFLTALYTEEYISVCEEEFGFFDDARERIEHIVELGRALEPIREAAKTEANRVRGCQSQVWMEARFDGDQQRLGLTADSDAIIVKGLITLVLRLYANRPPQEILDNPPDVFERIGLGKMLTPGRANGLYSMVNRVHEFARIYAKASA